ncbi:flagellar biosynthesis anti-sigma factor FlgM [Salinisphaera sp. SPP-AMP-43]|uniref:flagellar biosynthesis anti-sigma factor FlgM n=1 Tax=Salinisphaera sp. SPP-AMP-43 TaxID=3121288 RepID=UPI003C6DD379
MIDPTSNNNISRVNGSRAPESTQSTQRPDANPASKAPSESAQVKNLSGLNTQDSTQDIDATRVAEIRQGIADGTLSFDSGRIADGIIASAREMAGED